jgi:uroporphyrinogen-III synthase
VLCIAGGADAALLVSPPEGMEVVSLTRRFGRERARTETVALIGQVTAEALTRFCP